MSEFNNFVENVIKLETMEIEKEILEEQMRNRNNNNNYNRNSNINGGNRTNVSGGRGNNSSWQHNSQHRGGTPYSNRATADKFGGTTRGSSQSARQTSARQQQARQQVGGRQQAGGMDRGGAGGAVKTASVIRSSRPHPGLT